MSWGTELWDQYDNLSTHTQKGIDFCEKFSHYVKDRCSIESEYASKLKRLVRNYQPRKKEEEDYQFSYAKGYLSMLNEVHDIASQHEVIAESTTVMLKDVMQLIGEIKQERRKLLSSGRDLQKQLDNSHQQLLNCKKMYEKAFRESERAQENYKQADANINLSRAEVEKQKNISLQKEQQCEDQKSEYAAQLQNTNRYQAEHYTSLMPQVFQQLQGMDEKRIQKVQEFIKNSADIENSVRPIINTCIEGMHKAAASINAADDSKMVVDKFKSGFHHPEDIPFEDLSCTNENINNSLPNITPKNTVKSDAKGTWSGGGKKKRTGIRGLFSSAKSEEAKEDYSHLGPNQQKKKLNAKIEQIRGNLARERSEKDALLKMRDLYEKNPSYGDAAKISEQLEENEVKLQDINTELKKYEDFLAEAEGRAPAKNSNGHRGSYSGDSTMSSSTSDLSVQSTQPVDHKYSNSFPDVRMDQTDSSNLPEPESEQVTLRDDNPHLVERIDSFDDPAIGSCIALYAFDAASEGTISMGQDEQFYVTERDEDGWTRVRREHNGEEGYVPTSYIQVEWY